MFTSSRQIIDRICRDERVMIFVMFTDQVDEVATFLEKTYPSTIALKSLVQNLKPFRTADREIVRYDSVRTSDISGLSADAIVVSTSVLQTGANPPPIKLVLLFGFAYFVDGFLQGAGRAGRAEESEGHAVLLCTPFAVTQALRFGNGKKQGLLDMERLVLKGGDIQQSLTDWYDPVEILTYKEEDRPPQAKQSVATHADVMSVQRALQVSSSISCSLTPEP